MTDQTPSNIIPFDGFKPIDGNFTQVPNQVFELMPMLSGSELKCLLYIVRHTLGFHEPTKTITLDEFEHGRKTKKRARMDGGVGLGRETIANALKSLAERAIITRETDASDKARQKITYGLNRSENPTSVNQSENPTSEVGKSDRSGQQIRPRSVKETKETKPKKEKKASTDAPAIPVKEFMAAFIAGLGYTDSAYDDGKFMGQAKALAVALDKSGFKPDAVPQFIAFCRTQFKNKQLTPALIRDMVLPFEASCTVPLHIVEAEDAAPVHTPSTIAPDTKVIGDMTAAEFDALTDAERQAQIDLKLASIAGRIVGTEGGRRGREAARNELDELNKSA
jgi:phage replication O-like protein O